MLFSKIITINIGHYQSLKIGVEEAPDYQTADQVIIDELLRLQLPVTKKIRQCLQWQTIDDR